eukprot:1324453-Rhodomonas_salina.2
MADHRSDATKDGREQAGSASHGEISSSMLHGSSNRRAADTAPAGLRQTFLNPHPQEIVLKSCTLQ